MPASNVQAAFRHLVQTLKQSAELYDVPDDGASNAMKPAAAEALWRKVVLKVHPDQKGNPRGCERILRGRPTTVPGGETEGPTATRGTNEWRLGPHSTK